MERDGTQRKRPTYLKKALKTQSAPKTGVQTRKEKVRKGEKVCLLPFNMEIFLLRAATTIREKRGMTSTAVFAVL